MTKTHSLLSIIFILLFSFGFSQKNTTNERNYFLDAWQPRTFSIPNNHKTKSETEAAETINITIDAGNKIAKVLPTHFGVNTTFRNGDSMLLDGIRFPMYEKANLGAYRFPAGSGSNKYFYDGNIPTEFLIELNPIDGTQSSALKVENFVKFVDSLGSQATIVVNYFYARYGVTTEGTREARVKQAAEYAAGFVRKVNIELGANIQNWEIGNECYGAWEEGYDVNGSIVTGKEYGEDLCVFAEEMKKVDPTIKIGAVLYTKDTDWNPQVIKEVQNHADFFIIHEYFTAEKDATVENILGSIGQINDNYKLLETTVEQITDYTIDHFPIALTEFNCRGPHTTTMVNGMFFTQLLAEIVKNNYGMSTTWVSEWKWKSDLEPKAFLALQDPRQDDYTARPTYMAYYFYNKVFGDQMVSTNFDSSSVNAYASTFSSGEIGVAIVNMSGTTKTVQLKVNNLGNYKLNAAYWYEVYAKNINPGNTKFYINEETGTTEGGGPINFNSVLPYKKDFANNGKITLPPYSMNFVVLAGEMGNSIKDAGSSSTINIFPNPASNYIQVKSNNKITEYTIYSLCGKIIQQSTSNTALINIEHFKDGYYILELKTNSTQTSHQFIKTSNTI